MPGRSGTSPKRHILRPDAVTDKQVAWLLEHARYVGSGHHKRFPADYGFERVSPRPLKLLCDLDRVIPIAEATALLKAGIEKKMISVPLEDGFPKYIWIVSASGKPFESKTHPNTPGQYHGYPLEDDDDFRTTVLNAWSER